MAYLIFVTTVFCVVLWPAAAGVFRLLGLADDWSAAFRGGAGASVALWLVSVVDLVVGRWLRGAKLEPTADDGE